jgi:hypothetical protein
VCIAAWEDVVTVARGLGFCHRVVHLVSMSKGGRTGSQSQHCRACQYVVQSSQWSLCCWDILCSLGKRHPRGSEWFGVVTARCGSDWLLVQVGFCRSGSESLGKSHGGKGQLK